MLRVTFEIVPFGEEDHPNKRDIGQLEIGLQGVKGVMGEYVSQMSTDGKHDPENKVVFIERHDRTKGAFELVRRCLESHLLPECATPLPELTDEEQALAEELLAEEEEPLLICPKCSETTDLIGVEYYYDHPERYDGISEWNCGHCGTRWGRWSGKILAEGESEKRFGG